MCNHVIKFFGIVVKWNVSESVWTVIIAFSSFLWEEIEERESKEKIMDNE